MMLRSVLTLVLAVTSVGLIHAQSTIYTSSATFLSLLEPNYYTETFFDNPGTFPSGLAFSSGAFSFTANAAGGSEPIKSDGLILTTTFENQELIFTVTSGNVTAIGGIFLLTDVDGNPLQETMTITLNDGTTTSFTTSTSGTDYRGFISPGPTISELKFSAAGPNVFNAADDLTLGIAAAVPEPSTVALLGIVGVGASAYWYRRRNKKDSILA